MSGGKPAGGRSGGTGQASPHRIAPAYDLDAERAVLGSLLLYAEPRPVLRAVDRGLRSGSFYWEKHRNVFAAMHSLAKKNGGIDAVTVYGEMVRQRTKDEGTRALLDELAGYVPAAGNSADYADLVIEQAAWRKRLRLAYDQLEAIERRDEAAYLKVREELAPSQASEEKTDNVVYLRTMSEDGEVLGEERKCVGCEKLQDQLDGAQKEIEGWRARYANLQRDKDKEAAQNPHWLIAQLLFNHWKKRTGHVRSKWGPGRFYECEPFLNKYGAETFERAIDGLAYQPFEKMRRNGTMERFDGWDTLCKGQDAFERYASRAPIPWKSELNLSLQPAVEESGSAPQLQLSQAKEAS